jgi:hypothetical protein
LPVLLRNLDRDLYPRTAAALTAAGVLATRHRRLRRHQTLLLHHSVAVRTRAKARYRALGQEMEGSDADALCALVSALGLHDVLMFADARRRVQTLLDPFVTPIPGLSGALYPLAGIPFVAEAVKRAVGDLATATPL